MKTSDFSFDLPQELIAQIPPEERGASRLMVLHRRDCSIEHRSVGDLPMLLPPESVLVFNDSRVRKARIYGTKVGIDSATEREFLLLSQRTPTRWLSITTNTRRVKQGARFAFPDDVQGEIVSVDPPHREIEFDRPIDDRWLDRFGHVPLPPYIDRPDSSLDDERYQTVYAETTGSVAAPTAGLHFTDGLLAELRTRGVQTEFVTLHVGLGTFMPLRTEMVEEHTMHEESYSIDSATAERITNARREGRPIVAVGTTAVRTLESAWNPDTGILEAGNRSTGLFIYPGYAFKVVRHLFTNFHTPGSSLVVLVSAFAGRTAILKSYQEAIRRRYRFFSYGDAMLIL